MSEQLEKVGNKAVDKQYLLRANCFHGVISNE